tara:strand:+ start:1524 stop:3287 length:1764 start_codon:yes stop_codon:yes gene_type:complete
MRFIKFILFFFILNYFSFAQRQNPESFLTHRVKKNESLENLTKKYELNENEIIFYNPLIDKIGLKKRMVLKIPVYKDEKLSPKLFDSIKYKIHEVRSKETKWRLAYENQTTIKIIDSLNPEIINGLKIGQKIRLPISKSKLKVPEKDSTYNYYKVLPKEGYYRIEKKLGVNRFILDSLNPNIKNTGIKEGMILKVPFVNSGEMIVKNDLLIERMNLLDSISKTSKVKIALFLPFKTNDIILDSIEQTKSLLIDRNLHTISLDFLIGTKFAIKTASNNGVSVDLSVFDTQNDILIINDLLRSNDFLKFNVIVGPLITSNFDFLTSTKGLINIPKISPLSTNDVYLRKNVYQSIPRKDFLRKKMMKYLEKKIDSTQNIVLVVDSINRSIENELKKKFPYSLIIRPEKEDYLLPELVDSLLIDSVPNKVILESESFPLIASVISQMNAQNNSNRNVQLFTTYRGNAYETENISNKVMGGINFTYPTYYKKLPLENLTDFQNDYIELYGKLPNKESTRAYDLILDVILRIAFKEKLKKSIDVGETQYIENRFFYDETENESYTNKAFYILQHSGYDVIEIKDWEDETDISN